MESLATRIERDGTLDGRDAVGWIIRLAKALEPIHALGVAHGNISADAVEIDGTSRHSRGVLIDSRHLRDRVAYHSPERASGDPASPESDTWAAAVTLYVALTGTLPFPGDDDREVWKRILSRPASPLAVFDAGDDGLQRILDRAFEREPTTRLASIRELREALEAWHPDPGVKTLPPLDDDDAPASGAVAALHAASDPEDASRPTPVAPPGMVAQFVMPMEDDEGPTAVRAVPLTPAQLAAMLGTAEPAAQPAPAARPSPAVSRAQPGAGRMRVAKLPPPTPPPPKSTMPPPMSSGGSVVSPAPLAPPPALGLGGAVMMEPSPIRKAPAPQGFADAPTPIAIPSEELEATPNPMPVPARAAAVAPDLSPASARAPVSAPATPAPVPVSAAVIPVAIDDRPSGLAIQPARPAPAAAAEQRPPVEAAPSDKSAKGKGGSSIPIVLALVVAAGVGAFFFLRPQLFPASGAQGSGSVALAESASPSASVSSAPTTAASTAPTGGAPTSAAATTGSAAPTASPSAPVSAAPTPSASAAPSTSANATAAGSTSTAACLMPLFANNTFVEPPASLNGICQITDPRKGAEVVRAEIILGGQGRIVSDGMREWAVLGWYEMAAFTLLQSTCCASPPAIELPVVIPNCDIAPPLKELTAVAVSATSDDAKVQEAFDAYTKAAKCIARQGGSDSFGRKGGPQGGEDTSFKKTLDRVRAVVKKKAP